MNDILKTLFVDNPYLPEQVYAFCKTLPEYQEAEREYQAAGQKIADRLDPDTFHHFEEAQSFYMAQMLHIYYLFGLKLRQEVLSALGIR